MLGRHTSWIFVTFAWTLGCGEDPRIDLTNSSSRSPSSVLDASARVAVCDQAADGTACGQDKHCLFNACVENACGDGVRAGDEVCDDGNERDGDGCDQRCRMEPPPGCGNGELEPGEECEDSLTTQRGDCTEICTLARCGDNIVSPSEECDDGNTSNSDRCSSRCRDIPLPCGNGVIDADEACDDGNTEDGDTCSSSCDLPEQDAGADANDSGASAEVDAGGSSLDAGAPSDAGMSTLDAGAALDAGPTGPSTNIPHETPACAACRNDNCRAFQGLGFDFVAACLEGGDGFGTPRSGDPSFVQECIDTMNCAYTNKCGYSAAGLLQCFCGSKDASACQAAGAADGPCQAEIYGAARTNQLSTLIGSFGDISLPIGVANYFLQCDYETCSACKP